MLLSVNNIHKNYRNDKGEIARQVLNGLSLTLDKGEKIAIVGPSGSGKTTLLNLIGSIDSPDEGTILFKGKNIPEMDQQAINTYRNQEIGFIFQLHHLLPQCTVLENILVPTLVSGPKEGAAERARRLLERVGLEQHADSPPAQLSGGELQRVAVVRALINRPKLILADEPTGSLDRSNSEKIADLLVELNA